MSSPERQPPPLTSGQYDADGEKETEKEKKKKKRKE
jgi:hypothetical protein